MAINTYTDHKLTHAQLLRLERILQGKPHQGGGANMALLTKRLIYEKAGGGFGPTTAGREAMTQAKREGW